MCAALDRPDFRVPDRVEDLALDTAASEPSRQRRQALVQADARLDPVGEREPRRRDQRGERAVAEVDDICKSHWSGLNARRSDWRDGADRKNENAASEENRETNASDDPDVGRAGSGVHRPPRRGFALGR